MQIRVWAGAVLCVMLCGVVISADPAQQCEQSVLPANIELSRDLARVLLDLYQRSPTFKAQCERLARAEHLQVIVGIDVSLPSRCRALTNIHRRGREIRADVHLPPGSALIELVAHEFEHLLEQVEGLDLRRFARMRGSGVREVHRELFETERAIRVGRLVQDEARGERGLPAAD
jgi:hypothetical protein